MECKRSALPYWKLSGTAWLRSSSKERCLTVSTCCQKPFDNLLSSSNSHLQELQSSESPRDPWECKRGLWEQAVLAVGMVAASRCAPGAEVPHSGAHTDFCTGVMQSFTLPTTALEGMRGLRLLQRCKPPPQPWLFPHWAPFCSAHQLAAPPKPAHGLLPCSAPLSTAADAVGGCSTSWQSHLHARIPTSVPLSLHLCPVHQAGSNPEWRSQVTEPNGIPGEQIEIVLIKGGGRGGGEETPHNPTALSRCEDGGTEKAEIDSIKECENANVEWLTNKGHSPLI